MAQNVYQSTRQPLVVYRNQRGADVFRIERDGTVYLKGINFTDGTFLATASDTDASPSPSLPSAPSSGGTDGGEF